MATPITMDVKPVITPHLDLDHLPLADKDFQIKDTSSYTLLLKIHCLSKDRYLNHTNDIGLWDSNFPKYQFSQVHIFPEIVHMSMHPFRYELGIIVQISRRLSWGENGHEGQDELINKFICGIAHNT